MVIFLQTVGSPVNHTFFGVDISWDMMRMDIDSYIDQNGLLSLLIGGLTSSNMFFKPNKTFRSSPIKTVVNPLVKGRIFMGIWPPRDNAPHDYSPCPIASELVSTTIP